MKEVLQNIGLAVALVVVGFVLGTFTGRGCGPKGQPGADTVIVRDTVNLPPPVIQPNPVKVKIVSDPDTERRVDSLLAVVEGRDSLLVYLLQTRESTQSFATADPEGIRVEGFVFTRFDPIRDELLTRIELLPIEIPVRTITVTEIKVREVIKMEWLLGGVAAGMIAGMLLSK